MKKETYLTVTSVVFGLVSLVHLYRLVFGMNVAVNGIELPVLASVGGVILPGYLAYTAYRLRR